MVIFGQDMIKHFVSGSVVSRLGPCMLCGEDFDPPDSCLYEERPLRWQNGWAHAGCIDEQTNDG